MHQNFNLGSNGVDRVCSLRKIPTRLRGTNFCTSLTYFAPSFVRQPNSPECTQIVQNAPKLRGTNFCTCSAEFCIEFRMVIKQTRMHPNSTNAPKCQFRVTWGGSGAFVAKKSDATS